MDLLLQHAVGIRHALVLSQMLEPRFREERLDEAARLSGVLEDTPPVRAIAAALGGVEGVRSASRPCNFQRQVNGTASSAPPAAMKKVVGTLTNRATSPQSALPRVMTPKKTIT